MYFISQFFLVLNHSCGKVLFLSSDFCSRRTQPATIGKILIVWFEILHQYMANRLLLPSDLSLLPTLFAWIFFLLMDDNTRKLTKTKCKTVRSITSQFSISKSKSRNVKHSGEH